MYTFSSDTFQYYHRLWLEVSVKMDFLQCFQRTLLLLLLFCFSRLFRSETINIGNHLTVSSWPSCTFPLNRWRNWNQYSGLPKSSCRGLGFPCIFFSNTLGVLKLEVWVCHNASFYFQNTAAALGRVSLGQLSEKTVTREVCSCCIELSNPNHICPEGSVLVFFFFYIFLLSVCPLFKTSSST